MFRPRPPLLLSSDFSVFVPDRRGRPLSPHPYDPGHTVDKEVQDLQALFTRSGTPFLFGLSSGAVIALETARRSPLIHIHLDCSEQAFLIDTI